MKKNYFKFIFCALLFVWANYSQAQECLTGGCTVSTSQYPATTQTATGTFIPISSDMFAGEYALCNVTAGVNYQWSLCSTDGGAVSYDSQLTLFNGTTNAVICYSDDFCGNAAKIGWTATFTGTVKIQVNAYNCISNNTATTLVWKSTTTGSDAAIDEVYSLGTFATSHSNPHVVKAVVTNGGTTTLTNLIVTLNVSGANSFNNIQTIPSLPVGSSTIVSFTGFSNGNLGNNTITVSIPSDGNNLNNTKAVTQNVTPGSQSYAYGTAIVAGAGILGGTGELATKFFASSGATLLQVKPTFFTSGKSYRVRIYDATGAGGKPGTMIFNSTILTSAAGVNTLNLPAGITVPTAFYISIVQVTNNVLVDLGYQEENPLRPQTFYYNTSSDPTWRDASLTSNVRYMVETVLSSCQQPAQPVAISGPSTICGTAPVTYSVSAVTGATGYNWVLPSGWSGTSNSNSITVTPGATGGNITVAATNSCGSGTAQTLTVSTNPGPPAQPGAITGNAAACAGVTTTYSVAPVTGASTYTWTLPSGWSGTSTSNTISVSAGTSNGIISVIASNGCGVSAAQNLAVTNTTAPAAPGIISGNAAVCQNSTNLYSVSPVAGATSYIWTLPSGWTGSSTSNSINVIAGAGSGTVSVMASNSCGNSTSTSLPVTINTTPAQPGTISGPANVCQGSAGTYSIASVSGATTYNWVLPAGWSGSSTSNSITATAGSTGGNISVTVTNSCGTSLSQTFAVTSTPGLPAQPGTISGNAIICPAGNGTYSVAPVTGATSYTWTLPAGWSGTSTTNSINVVAGTTSGTISLIANNGCGSSASQSLAVAVSAIVLPGAITGPGAICQGNTATYSVPAVTGATTYTWTLPTGWTGSSNTNTITVTAGGNGNIISVSASDGQCTSPVRTWSLTVYPLPAIPTITSAGGVLASSSATGNQWLLNGTVIASATNQFYTPTQNGFYSVMVTNANCSSISSPFTVTSVGISEDFANSIKLKVYPNPADNLVRIEAGSQQDMQIEVHNIIGKVILRSDAPAVNGKVDYQLNTSTLAPGIYLLNLKNKNGSTTSRLVIQ